MTPTTRSGCFYDPLVSVHPSLEPAECSLRKLLCIADGKMERGVTGRLEGLEKMIMGCVDIFPVVLPLTRPTGRVLSTAGEWSCSSAPRQLYKRQEMHITPRNTFISLLQSIDDSRCFPMLPHGLQFRPLSTITLFVPAYSAVTLEAAHCDACKRGMFVLFRVPLGNGATRD